MRRLPHEAWTLARVLDALSMKMGHTNLPALPRYGPQAGKSGDPHSQDANNSPWAQGTLGLGFKAKPKGKRGASWALSACGYVWRVATDWTWASALPHAASQLPD